MSKDKPMKEEFKTVRSRDDVRYHFKKFVKKPEVKVRNTTHCYCIHVGLFKQRKFLEELRNIRRALDKSVFFAHHEVSMW